MEQAPMEQIGIVMTAFEESKKSIGGVLLGGERRWRLLEGDLRPIRLIDTGNFTAEFHHEGTAVTLMPERSAGRLNLRMNIDGQEFTKFTLQLVEFCLWMPVPLAALRLRLIEYARILLNERASLAELGDSLALTRASTSNTRRSTDLADSTRCRPGHRSQVVPRSLESDPASCICI